MIEIAKPIFGVILVLLVILAGILSYKATRNTKSKFDFAEAFLDHAGKTSLARVGQFSALAVSTWGFVFLVIDGKMSEWYMTIYTAAWVGNGFGHKWLDNKTEAK